MRSISLAICGLLAVAGTVAAGWSQGRLTNRWGPQPDAALAADRLNVPLPQQAGNWRLEREQPFADAVVRVLQCPAHISRVYVHEQTGDFATVAVIVGPHGPVAVHTPEICYSSRDYSIAGPRKEAQIRDAAGESHTLWDLSLKANDLDGNSLRVLYGWSSGTAWEAAKHPRFSYGGLPHLYKLQVAVTVQSDATGFDPAEDFLTQFVAQLQPRLVEASRHSAPAR
jgi:hypothetical protein